MNEKTDTTDTAFVFGILCLVFLGTLVLSGIRLMEISNPTCKLSMEGAVINPTYFEYYNHEKIMPAFNASGKFEIEGPCSVIAQITESASNNLGGMFN